MKKLISLLIVLAVAFAVAFTALGCAAVGERKPDSSLTTSENYSEGKSPHNLSPAENSEKAQEETVKYAHYALAVAAVNVRKAPSSESAIVGKIDKGDLLAYIGEESGWRKVWYRGAAAYLSAAYTDLYSIPANGEYEDVISVAEKLLGTPYVYGATRPLNEKGKLISSFDINAFDCSSFVQYAFYYGKGVKLDVTSRLQSVQGEFCPQSEIKRGTVMFFTNSSRYNKTGMERIGHVGIYFGDGYILHTASDYAVIEKISSTRSSYYITARNI